MLAFLFWCGVIFLLILNTAVTFGTACKVSDIEHQNAQLLEYYESKEP